MGETATRSLRTRGLRLTTLQEQPTAKASLPWTALRVEPTARSSSTRTRRNGGAKAKTSMGMWRWPTWPLAKKTRRKSGRDLNSGMSSKPRLVLLLLLLLLRLGMEFFFTPSTESWRRYQEG